MIESIEFSRHRLTLDPPFEAAWDRRPRHAFPVTVVRVRDHSGAVGIAAGDPMRGLEDYLDLFIGTDPADLDRHAAVLANIAFHDGRPWPLEVALWDLVGKLTVRPIWAMLGGEGRPVRAYASSGTIRSPSETVDLALEAEAAGFGGLKLRFGRPSIEDDIEVVGAVASATSGSFEVMVDCNQGWRMPWDTEPPWDVDHAAWVADRLSELGVYWIEEPLHRGDHAGMAELRTRSSVLIAGGEMTREIHELDLMLAAGSLDVFQPDAIVTGGLAGLAGLARRVASAGLIFTPHTWGSGVALLANLHLTSGTVGAPFIEYPWDPPAWTADRRDFLLREPIVPDDRGMLHLPDGPGLGCEPDEDRLAATKTESSSYR